MKICFTSCKIKPNYHDIWVGIYWKYNSTPSKQLGLLRIYLIIIPMLPLVSTFIVGRHPKIWEPNLWKRIYRSK